MKNGILNELISTMRERIPQDMNLANTLADILCMGKEAVYRRLRGEVSFTIDEVALLSQKLGISIDQIVGSHVSNKVTFDLNLLLMHIDDPFIYRHLFQRMWRLYISILIHPSAKTEFRQILIGRIE